MTEYPESPGLREMVKDLAQTLRLEQLAAVTTRNMNAIEAISSSFEFFVSGTERAMQNLKRERDSMPP